MPMVIDPITGFYEKSSSYRQVRTGGKGKVDTYIYFKRPIDPCRILQSLGLVDDRHHHDHQPHAPL